METEGESNTFTKDSTVFTITKTNNGYSLTYSNNTTSHNDDDKVTIDGLLIVFGGVSISSALKTVVVNLDIAVDASGKLDIYGEAAPQVVNVIDAGVELDAAALYSTTNSMFEFWEPADDRTARTAQLATSEGRDWRLLTRKLANGIHACLEGEFKVKAAAPFSASKYITTPPTREYEYAPNFGEVALRSYTHYTLGHIDSTYAITNDDAFVSAMLARETSRGDDVDSDDFTTVPVAAGTNANANLANLLVKQIATKTPAAVLLIANQVLGQDVSRAMGEDNNAKSPAGQQALKFIAGDVIYMNIKLQEPEVFLGAGQQVTSSTLKENLVGENYTLKITLS
jgi:hypothetical protein